MQYIVFHDRNWTWIKFDGIPPEETRTGLKEQFKARWGRKRQAWYIQDEVFADTIAQVVGKPALGEVDGRAPTKTWSYCMALANVEMEQPDMFGGPPKIVQAGKKTKTPDPAKLWVSKNNKIAKRLRSMADRLTGQIEDKRRPMTQNPTPRRNQQYRMRLHDAADLERLQQALYALADAYDADTVPPALEGITSKKALAPLVHTRADTCSGGYYGYRDTGEFANTTPASQAIQAMIAGQIDPEAKRKAEVDQMNAEAMLLIGQVPGFFPTPPAVVFRMLSEAAIADGMEVLEPSAGHGAIADKIAADYPEADLCCIEWNHTLAKTLEKKGHRVIGHDFMEHGPANWDRIVMNPPFEKMQDVDHVLHAFDCLKPGGRLVSIMSESPFFRKDKKAVAFREWLEEVGWSTRLPGDAFKESGTGVQTRVVVIDKPKSNGHSRAASLLL